MENILETIDNLQQEGRKLAEKKAVRQCISLSNYMDKVEKAGGSRRKALELVSEYLSEQLEHIELKAKAIKTSLEDAGNLCTYENI